VKVDWNLSNHVLEDFLLATSGYLDGLKVFRRFDRPQGKGLNESFGAFYGLLILFNEPRDSVELAFGYHKLGFPEATLANQKPKGKFPSRIVV
jgi:hypothetical protein